MNPSIMFDPDQYANVFKPVEQAETLPPWCYRSEEFYQAEVTNLFMKTWNFFGHVDQVKNSGDYITTDYVGVPILIVRGREGAIRAFANNCRHRGAPVAKGSGNCLLFTCPYHSWSYDNAGALVGIYKREDFGDVDTSCLGLTPLPVAERAGLIFGVLTPGVEVDFDAFLCGYDELLVHHDFEHCNLVGRQSVAGPNWKVAYDGYLDFYHLPILHKDSFGAKMPSDALYDAWGPHQRVSMPDPRYLELEKKPEEEWNTAHLIGGV